MTNVTIKILNTLTADSTLTAIVPAASITVGPVDITQETQAQLMMPSINIFQVSEVGQTVPKDVRQTVLQIDIWSRNSQLELETIYERVVTLLNYLSGDQSSSHIFWTRLDNAPDLYEADRRIWHRPASFRIWEQ